MSYVMIRGGGLSGLAARTRKANPAALLWPRGSPGALGGPLRLTIEHLGLGFGGLGAASPYVVTSVVRGVGGLGGLGAASVDAVKQQFTTAVSLFIEGIQKRGDELVAATGYLSRGTVREQVDAILANINQGVESLCRVDATGEPLFVRKPEQSQQILRTIESNATGMMSDLAANIKEGLVGAFGSEFDVMLTFLKTAVRDLVQILVPLIAAGTKAVLDEVKTNPVPTMLALGAVGLILWLRS